MKKIIFFSVMLMVLNFALFAQEVSPSGAFTYSVPIEVPPGTNGTQPNLALVYNSQAGNGMLGMGWNLSGLSVISRDRSYDVDFDDLTDHFVLDGQRLIKDENSLYHTQVENYSIIEMNNPGTSSSWTVSTKAGMKMYYGATDDSRIEAVGKSGQALMWRLNKVEDVLGNYMTVEYAEDEVNGDSYPIKIEYTMNESHSLNQTRTVEFLYEARDDHGVQYIPTAMDTDYRMKWVVVKIGGNLLRKYGLDYEDDSQINQSRLVSLTEYGSDGNVPFSASEEWVVDGAYVPSGSCKPAIEFDWADSIHGFNHVYANLGLIGFDLADYRDQILTPDFNGDGKSDVLVYRPGEGPCYIGLAKSDGSFDRVYTGMGLIGFDLAVSKDRIITPDFNGDGKSDVLLYRPGNAFCYIGLSNGDGTFNQVYAGLGIIGFDLNNDNDQILTPDFNGDGKSDILVYRPGEGPCYIGLSKGDGSFDRVYVGMGLIGFDLASSKDRIITPDFNSDGKSDVLIYRPGNAFCYIGLSIGNGNFNLVYTGLGLIGFDLNDNKDLILASDFNGDGKSDVLCYRPGNAYCYIGLHNPIDTNFINTIKNNQGGQINIQYTPAPQIPGAIVPESGNYPVVANKSTTALVTKVSYSNGLGSASSTSYEYHNGKSITGVPTERKSLGFEWTKTINDATGAYTKTWYYQEEQEAKFAGMVKRRENYGSDGLLYTAVDNVYESREEIEATSDYHAVNYIWMSDTYTYNHNGDNSSAPIITWKHIDEPDALGNITRSIDYGECQYNSYNQEIIEDAYEYDNFIKEIQYASPIENRTVSVKEVQKEYGLDQFDEYSSPEFIETEIRYYYDGNELSGYFTKGLLTKEVQENGDNDKVTAYGYDFWGNREWTKDTKFLIDQLPGYREHRVYDSDYHTYLVTTTNAIGHSNQIIYDNGENTLMRPTEKIDGNGISSKIIYDSFGRVIKEILTGDNLAYPTQENQYTKALLNEDGTINRPYSHISISKDGSSNGYQTYTYFDGFGKKIQIKSEGTNNQWHTKDLFYNESGKLYKESEPYFTDSSDYSLRQNQLCTETSFDEFGRINKVTKADGTTTSSLYMKNSVFTLDANNHLSEKAVDKNVIINRTYTGTYTDFDLSQIANNLYTETKHYTAKNGTRIVDIAGNTIETRMDLLGQSISYSDPDLGTWTYTYDSNGNLQTQTDAKGNTITYTYDLLNRRLTKTSDTSTIYNYDEINHGYSKGQLTSVSYSGGSESYIYDARGRVTSTTKTIGSKSATQSYEYDSMNRITKTTYPTGEEVYTNYAENLNLLNMGYGNTAGDIQYYYAQNYTYNALGQIDSINFGNNLQTTYSYNAGHRVESMKIYNQAGMMVNTDYQYDNTGNIVSKMLYDIPANLVATETYTYDEFNRLVTTNSSGVHGYNQDASELFEYNNLNNITRKYKNVDGVIQDRYYAYHATKKHAVIDDGVYTYQYDNNGNMTARFENGVQNRGFFYDADNRVTSITDGGFYSYNDKEERIYKSENGIQTYYFFPNYEEEVSDSETLLVSYYFANSQRIAKRTQLEGQSESTLVYIHADHLQSATRVTDADGFTIQTTLFTAYGEVGFTSGNQDLKYTYTNQESEGNGLMYYGARFYDPALGRFLKADIMMDGLNRYAYCGNNPIIFIDPSGNFKIDPFGFTILEFEVNEKGFIFSFDIFVAKAHLGLYDGNFMVGGGSFLAEVNLGIGKDGFYLDAGNALASANIELQTDGTNWALSASVNTLVGGAGVYVNSEIGGIGVYADTLVAGFDIYAGFNRSGIDANIFALGSVGINTDYAYAYLVFSGGVGYSFYSGQTFSMEPGFKRLWGNFAGNDWTDGQIMGMPGYSNKKDSFNRLWRDPADLFAKSHDWMVPENGATTADGWLRNACTNYLLQSGDNYYQRYNKNAWAGAKSALMYLYFSFNSSDNAR